MKLYTIPMSHYAEKARFALVRTGLPWEEERHVQGPHYLVSLRVGRTPLMPILRDGAQVVCDSTAILRHLDGKLAPEHRLFGDARVAELEDRFDRELGVHTRRLAYFHLADRPADFLAIAGQGTPRWERALMSLAFPLARRFAFLRLGIRREEIAESVAIVRRTFGEMDRRLCDHRYLVGDRFSAADLGFACMAAPVILPREYGVELPTIDRLPPQLAGLVRELRETSAGRFVLRVFAEERRAVV